MKPMGKPLRIIGLTGGIGAGKTAAAACFAQLGIPVFSADKIAREVLAPGTPGLQEVEKNFGAEVIKNGELDRAKLRALIIQKPEARATLDAITHPRIQEKSEALMQTALKGGAPFVVYEAPLLFEAKSDKRMDAVICVTADDEVRVKRTMARDDVSRDAALALLHSQMPQAEKMGLSDFVIENNGSQVELEKNVREIFERISGKK